MIQISAPMETIAKICGKQTIRPGTALRESSLCVRADCEDGTLLYHSLTGAMYLQPRKELTEDERSELARNWFLVPEDFDEHAFADKAKKIIRMVRYSGSAKTDFSIITTTDCNARCFYCFQIGIPRFNMSGETAEATAEYLIRVSKGKPIIIRWFGGEPLYNREVIDRICDRLNESGTAFRTIMVTNGYYLDAETIRHAWSDWRLRKAQITIDGTEEIYNRTKAYIDRDKDESPFQRVLKHIGLAADAGIEISIRLNMDANNAEDLLRLCDELGRRFAGKAEVGVYPALLAKFAGAGKVHAFETEQAILNSYYAIEDKLESFGLMKDEPLFRKLLLSRCMADNEESEAIMPDGRIGQCDHYGEDTITGSIFDDRQDEAALRAWREPLVVPECADCALYPLCPRLKKCEWICGSCSAVSRSISLHTLQKQMRKAYEKSKREENPHETEE